MTRPRLLDLFCCEGGAAMGYHRAGFEVVGVDINPQPRYPFEFHRADALAFLAEHGREFEAVHASPPAEIPVTQQAETTFPCERIGAAPAVLESPPGPLRTPPAKA